MKNLALACLLVVPACLSGEYEIPADAYIDCQADADCPEGYVCSETRGLCLAPSGDFTAPAFLPDTFTVDPITANEGTVIEVGFTVTEELAALPVVRLGNPGPEFTFYSGTCPVELGLMPQGCPPPEYVYQYTVDGTEAEDSIGLLVELMDLAGNVATLGGLVVTLDFTDPVAMSPTIDNDTVNEGDIVTVTFTASEALGRMPDVVWMTTVPGPEAFTHDDTSARNYTFTLDTTDLDPATANVKITLTDEAGNVSETIIGPLTVQ